MAARHAQPFLPQHFEMLEDDTIGTHSGNPTSNVVYGFRNSKLDGAPVFTIAEVLPKSLTCPDERAVRAFGSFIESDYLNAMQLLKDDREAGWDQMIGEYDTVHSGKVSVEITVPHVQTVEFILGHALKIISFEG